MRRATSFALLIVIVTLASFNLTGSAISSPRIYASLDDELAAPRVKRCLGERVNLEETSPDFYLGRAGNDVANGRRGDDRIFGLPGNDRLCGGRGDDLIEGQTGFDRINGGRGYDICRTAERVRNCEEFD